MSNQDIVTEMFKKKYPAYSIHIMTGISIKQVYHYIAAAEREYALMLKKRHLERVANELG